MRILDATIDTSKMIEQDPLFQQWMMNAVHFRAETENGRLDGQDIHLLSSYSQLEDATEVQFSQPRSYWAGVAILLLTHLA